MCTEFRLYAVTHNMYLMRCDMYKCKNFVMAQVVVMVAGLLLYVSLTKVTCVGGRVRGRITHVMHQH